MQLYDLDTLLELENFVRLPNYTFSKRKDDDLDDRVLALVWALFILDPSIAAKYYQIIETDDQGRPLKIKPFVDNSDLIKKSPLFHGQVSGFKKTTTTTANFSFVGKLDENNLASLDQEAMNLQSWLLNWGSQPPSPKEKLPETDKLLSDEYRPVIVF